jgi:lipid-A-disaccharide synthase
VGLFPGSRRSEVSMLLPIMIDAAKELSIQDDALQVVLPLAPGLDRQYLDQFLVNTDLPIKVIEGDFYDVTKSCDAIVAASGTVTLEIALLGVPHFISYRVAPLTYRILKRLVKIPYVGLCNIVTSKPIVLELLQDDVTTVRVTQELSQRLYDSQSKRHAEHVRQQVLSALGPSGGAHNAALQIITLIS